MTPTLRRPMAPHLRAVLRAFVLAGLLIGSAMITAGSVGYFDDDDLPEFVIEKLPLAREDLWFAALRTHVVAAAFALPACLLLLSRRFLARLPVGHRWLGRLTGGVLLCALAPSGFVLALDAKGGLPVTVGFALSGLIVVVGTVAGVRTARRRQFVAHRRAMLHVTAQLAVAVTSRAMLVALDACAVDPDVAYVVALWVPVVASAGVVELFTARPVRHDALTKFERRKHVPVFADPLVDPLVPGGVRIRDAA